MPSDYQINPVVETDKEQLRQTASPMQFGTRMGKLSRDNSLERGSKIELDNSRSRATIENSAAIQRIVSR